MPRTGRGCTGLRSTRRAVSVAALRALRAAGAEHAIVCPRGDPAHPGPLRLYRDLGFVPDTRTLTFSP